MMMISNRPAPTEDAKRRVIAYMDGFGYDVHPEPSSVKTPGLEDALIFKRKKPIDSRRFFNSSKTLMADLRDRAERSTGLKLFVWYGIAQHNIVQIIIYT